MYLQNTVIARARRRKLTMLPGGPTQIHEVDMVAGDDAQVGSISGRQINAIGYNPLDNFIYGWDNQNDVFVRVHSDHTTVDELTITGYTGPSSGIIIGDVDENGHYWMLSGTTWYQIDLTTPSPTQIATGTPGANPAFYADPNGHLYASSNSTGNIWRIDVGSTHTSPLMLGKTVDIETDGFPGIDARGDAGERVTTSIPANSGTASYELNFPTATFTADSMARFRLFDGVVADPQPTGSAAGGEVEDVLVQVGSYHPVDASGLANTGMPVWLPVAFAGGLVMLSFGVSVYYRQRAAQKIHRK